MIANKKEKSFSIRFLSINHNFNIFISIIECNLEFHLLKLDENDKIKVFKCFYKYNNFFGLISQDEIQDCQQAEFLEKSSYLQCLFEYELNNADFGQNEIQKEFIQTNIVLILIWGSTNDVILNNKNKHFMT
ncbi:unnamed protein product [Paramecium octaurelia]|uniref:Uncharacterized protein n=1 Tax=Paramecium octaurelia TaxID=43137 RepID=A0A8S1UNL0_PAROT|nr:unnamed protein product [Paramecium octaurelia]